MSRRNRNKVQIHIRQGDIIKFKFENDGYLMSTAINDKGLQIQQQDDNKPCSNQYDFNFTVMPKVNFESRTAFNHFQSLMRSEEGVTGMNLEEASKKLELFSKRADKESVMNQNMISFKNGKDLLYGDTVILMHFHSSLYLRVDDLTLIKDNRTCRIQLSEEVDEKCLFKLIPGYEFRVDGHQVQKGDLVILYNEKTDRYIHVGRDNVNKIGRDPYNRFAMRKFAHPEPFIKREVSEFANLFICNAMIDENKNIKFTVILFRPYEPTEDVVCAGDIIKLYHTDHKGYLCAELVAHSSLRPQIQDPEDLPLFVRKCNKDSPGTQDSEHCGSLFEIEYWNDFDNETKMVDREPQGRIALQENFNGQKCKYSLRHLITGSFLQCYQNEHKKYPCLSSFMDNSVTENIHQTVLRSTLTFLSKNQSKGPSILYNHNVQIENKFDDDNLDQHRKFREFNFLTDFKKDKNQDFKPPDQPITPALVGFNHDSKFQVPIVTTANVTRVPLCYESTANNKDTFSIKKVDIEYVNKIKRVQQAISIVKRFVSKLRDEHTQESIFKDKELIKKLEERVDNLLYFIFGIEDTHGYGDTETLEEIPNLDHQRIFRDLYIMECLVDLLQQSVKEFVRFERNIAKVLFRTLNKVQRLIRFTVQDNNKNQQYVSQWMNLFFSHINPKLLNQDEKTLEKLAQEKVKVESMLLKPETVLTLIYSNNAEILSQVDESQIEKVVKQLTLNDQHERYLNILSAMCVCCRQPMIMKQKAIINMLTMNSSYLDAFLHFEVKIVNGQLMVNVPKMDKDFLFNKDFIFNKKEYSQQYAYLLAQIDLLGALCEGSFKEGIALAKRKYSVDKIIQILQVDETHQKFKVKLINLCKKIQLDGPPDNIYIEQTNTTQSQLDIKNGETDLFIRFNEKSEKDVYKLKNLVKFILMSKKKQVLGAEDSSEQHQVCNAILLLFNALMDQGYIINHKEIAYFSSILIHNLDSKFDQATQREPAQKYTPTQDNMVIFENKKLMCDMLNNILSIRVNVVNQYFLNIIARDRDNEELDELQEPVESIQSADKKNIKTWIDNNSGKDDNNYLAASSHNMNWLIRNKPYWDLNQCIQDHPVKINIFNKNQLSILADLLKFQDNSLLNKVLQILFREFKFKSEVISNLKDNHIIENDNFSEHIFYWCLRLKAAFQSTQKFIKNQITNPSREQSLHCQRTLQDCAKHLRFLVYYTIKNEEAHMSQAHHHPQPSEMEVYFEQMLKTNYKQHKIYLDFLVTWSNESVQLRWFNIQRNCQVWKTVIEFLFHPIIYKEMLNPKLVNLMKEEEDDKKDAYHDPYQHIRHISFIRPHLINWLIYFSMASDKNRKKLYPQLPLFVANGKYKESDQCEVECSQLFNKLSIEIIIDNSQFQKDQSSMLIVEIIKFVRAEWQSGNWEVVLSVDNLRRLIYFRGEQQKENQILILLNLELDFLSKILKMLLNEVKTFTEDSKLDKQQHEIEKKATVNAQDLKSFDQTIKLKSNPQLEGFWTEDGVHIDYNILLYERIVMLMIDLVAGNNEATVSQIKRVFKPEYALELFQACGFYYIPKWILSTLLINLYQDNDKDEKQLVELSKYLIIQFSEEITNAVTVSSKSSDPLKCSRQRVLQLHSLTKAQGYIDYLNQITDCVAPFAFILLTKQDHFPSRTVAEKLKDLQKTMAMDQNIFNEFSKSYEFVLQRLSVNDMREEFKQLANEVFDINFNSEWNNSKLREHATKDFYKKFSISNLKTINELNIDENRIQTRIKMLEFNELLEQEFNEDFNSLVSQLLSIEDCNEIFIKVIKILLIGDRVLNEEIVVSLLRLLRRMIENANKTKTQKAIQEWDLYDCEQDKEINEVQEYLYNMGACEMIFKVFIDYEDQVVRDECIKFSIGMLYSGNELIQEWFCQKFESSEKDIFFQQIIEIINTNFEIVAKFEVTRINSFLEKALLMDDDDLNSEAGVNDNFEEIAEEQDSTTELSMCIVIRMFRFLQLLCENHNHELQDKLREQDNGKSVNIIEMLSKLFGRYLKIFNKRNIIFGIQILTTIIETIQGPNKKNQLTLVEEKVVDNVRDIMFLMRKEENLEKKYIKNDDKELVIFNTKIMILLTSLLEGNPNYELTLKIQQSCEFQILVERLRKIFTSFCKFQLKCDIDVMTQDQVFKMIRYEYNTKHQINSLILKEGFNITILMLGIITLIDDARSFVQNFQDVKDKLSFDFFKKNIGNVEIDIDDDLFTIYFPILPVCRHLTSMTIDYFNETIDRENYVSKISGLLENQPYFLREMQINEDLMMSNSDSAVNILNPQIVKILADTSQFIAIIQNLMILLFIKRQLCYFKRNSNASEPGQDQGDCPLNGVCLQNTCHQGNKNQQSSEWYNYVKSFLGYLQTTTSFLLFLIWYKTNSTLATYKYWHKIIMENRENFRRDNKTKGMDDNEIKRNLDQVVEDAKLVESEAEEEKVLQLKGPWSTEFMLNHDEIDGTPKFHHFSTQLMYEWTSTYSILANYNFIYQLLQILFSLLGNFQLEFFQSYHLFDIVKRYASLQNVVKSITLNVSELSLTIIFMFIINQTFSGVAFLTFTEEQVLEDFQVWQWDGTDFLQEVDSPCTYMLQCFLQTLNFGLKNGGGVGDAINTPVDTSPMQTKAFAFVMAQFFFINVLLLNVIFGTIINTFAELRNTRISQEFDMNNNCFICSLNRDEIDRIGQPFEYHVETIHNKLNQVQQLVHMDQKSLTEQDGIESKVQDKRVTGDFSWIPLQTTKKLKELNSSEGEGDIVKELEDDIDDIDTALDMVFDKLNKISSTN